MRNSIAHLPISVQSDLKYITTFLMAQTNDIHTRHRASARIRYIILHGCFTEEHWTPDTPLLSTAPNYGYNFLLLVSKNLTDLRARLGDAVKQLNQSDKISFPVSIRVDTRGQANQMLEEGYLAYDQIQTCGICLYNISHADQVILFPQRQYPADQHYIQACNHFDRCFSLIKTFVSGAHYYQNKGARNVSAVMLDLAATQIYAAFIVVHVLKQPSKRRLHKLRNFAESIHPELKMIWAGSQAEPCFDLLKSISNNIRFSENDHVRDRDLNLMIGYVEDLHKLVEYICQLKLEKLQSGSLNKPNKNWLTIIEEGLKRSNLPEQDKVICRERSRHVL